MQIEKIHVWGNRKDVVVKPEVEGSQFKIIIDNHDTGNFDDLHLLTEIEQATRLVSYDQALSEVLRPLPGNLGEYTATHIPGYVLGFEPNYINLERRRPFSTLEPVMLQIVEVKPLPEAP